MFLFGTVKLRYLIKCLIKSRRGGPVCPPARIKSTVVCVDCMYLFLHMAQGTWRFAHQLTSVPVNQHTKSVIPSAMLYPLTSERGNLLTSIHSFVFLCLPSSELLTINYKLLTL